MLVTGEVMTMRRTILLLVLAVSFADNAGADSAQPADGPGLASRTAVVLLGTGTPNADPDAHGPALAVVVDDHAYLVDCGPGVVRRAAAAYLAGVDALAVERLDRLFLTHLHSDHTIGYPDLIGTPWVLGRETALEVVGPPGTSAMTDHLLAAYSEDRNNRLEGLEPANDGGHQVAVTEFAEAGEVYRDERVTVRSFVARHGAWEHAYGFRFSTPDAEICISGDTAPYPEMTENYAGCDILVHEVYAAAGFAGRDEEWQAYHRASHTSGGELAGVAAQVRPGLLILTHVLTWEASRLDLLEEVAAGYDGQLLLGVDLTYIGLSPGFRSVRDGERAGSFLVLPVD
jgi:ribonuclease BN (tRNA processing enzyme)